MMDASKKTIAIITCGGPAPGINNVIYAIARAAAQLGWNVLGIKEGFKYLLRKDFSEKKHTMELEYKKLTSIQSQGGSILFMTRNKPKKENYQIVKKNLEKIGVSAVISIGGDDTATNSYWCFSSIGMPFVHVPKTIDNDLPIYGPTFGYKTAVDLSAKIIRNLSVDTSTVRDNNRWFFVTCQGREAGHLAMAIACDSGANMAIIPEMFSEEKITFEKVAWVTAGGILNRLCLDKPYGTVVFAEGLLGKIVDKMNFDELKEFEKKYNLRFKFDDSGNLRQSEVDLGAIIREVLEQKIFPQFNFFNILEREMRIITKKLGYEIRCQPANAADQGYCTELGISACIAVTEGKTNVMVCKKASEPSYLSISDMIKPVTRRDKNGNKITVQAIEPRMLNLKGLKFSSSQFLLSTLIIDGKNPEPWQRISKRTKLDVEILKEYFGVTLPKEHCRQKIPK